MNKKQNTPQVQTGIRAAYLFPGMFIESRFENINIPDEKTARKKARNKPDCIGYELYKCDFIQIDGRELTTEPVSYKVVYFGKLYTPELLRKEGLNDALKYVTDRHLDGIIRIRTRYGIIDLDYITKQTEVISLSKNNKRKK